MTQEIQTLIENKDFKGLKAVLQDMLVPDIADLIDQVEDQSITTVIFRLLSKDLSAEVFSYISPEIQEDIMG
jgi:magnesium transporter